jgi:hypothetical protein
VLCVWFIFIETIEEANGEGFFVHKCDQRGMIWCFHNKAICTLFQTERIIGGHKWFDLCLDPIEVRTQFSTTHIYKSDLYPLST